MTEAELINQILSYVDNIHNNNIYFFNLRKKSFLEKKLNYLLSRINNIESFIKINIEIHRFTSKSIDTMTLFNYNEILKGTNKHIVVYQNGGYGSLFTISLFDTVKEIKSFRKHFGDHFIYATRINDKFTNNNKLSLPTDLMNEKNYYFTLEKF